MTKLHMTTIDNADMLHLVQQFHYSKRNSSAIQHAFAWREEGGLFGDRGEPLAAISYSHPVNRHAPPKSIELSRLVRRDDFKQSLSQFVAWSLRELKRTTDLDFCMSYADYSQGHHGGIYQATNFTYVGERKRRHIGFEDEYGNFVHARSAYAKVGTSSIDKVAKLVPNWHPIFGDVKHLYIYPLRKKLKHVLADNGWVALPYPKPDKNMEEAA